jgi:hypothetical protein
LGEKDEDWLTSSAGKNLGFHRIVGRKIKG